MVARIIGAPDEVVVTAARAVVSGDLHECDDGRCGVYLGAQDRALGDSITLCTNARVELVAGQFAEALANALANFNYTTQELVVSGGDDDIGRYEVTKPLNQETARVLLNSPGPSA